MMENSIEEDIERLKLCSTNQCNICGRYEKEECMLERNRCEQHILSEYKRVLKENEKLKRKNIMLEELLQGNLYELYKYYKELADTYQGNCIPVQKVKDKIEELKEKEQGIKENEWLLCSSINHMKIQVLQELLESEE